MIRQKVKFERIIMIQLSVLNNPFTVKQTKLFTVFATSSKATS